MLIRHLRLKINIFTTKRIVTLSDNTIMFICTPFHLFTKNRSIYRPFFSMHLINFSAFSYNYTVLFVTVSVFFFKVYSYSKFIKVLLIAFSLLKSILPFSSNHDFSVFDVALSLPNLIILPLGICQHSAIPINPHPQQMFSPAANMSYPQEYNSACTAFFTNISFLCL